MNKEFYRVLCRPLMFQGQRAFLIVPSSLIEDQNLSRTLARTLIAMAPFLLCISSLGGYALSRRSLRPIDNLIEEAQSITARDLSRRLAVPAAEDEMRRLTLTWNDLLARIERTLKQIEQFTADASHELRSPIAFIRATAQDSLQHGYHDEETAEALRAIIDETSSTAEMLDCLLILARVDAGVPQTSTTPVNVQQTLVEVCQRYISSAEKKQLKLLWPLSTRGDIHLHMAESHFRQVITILLENAIKYTPPGGRVTVTYEAGGNFSLVVSDTGCGIEQEHLPRVFDRFYRADSARTNATEGVGLGLPIAKAIVDLYQGTIEIRSEVGLGTRAVVELPSGVMPSRSV